MTARIDMQAWLGDFAADVTDEQLDQLVDAANAIEARWPAPDLADVRERALSAAAQVILGDSTLEEIAEAWQQARTQEAQQQQSLTGALIASWSGARSGPGSEGDLIARSGASRMTVRKAIGR